MQGQGQCEEREIGWGVIQKGGEATRHKIKLKVAGMTKNPGMDGQGVDDRHQSGENAQKQPTHLLERLEIEIILSLS